MTESLRAKALKLLARREHTRAELARKLAVVAQDPAEIEAVLEDFEKRGWLSEKRVVEQLVHARRPRFGTRRIERDLRQKGVSQEAVAAALPGLKSGELDAAREIWRRKFGGRMPRTPAERARQARFLQGRGFDFEIIMKIIKDRDEG